MPRTTAAVGHRTLSGATALVFGGGLALYQVTSLVLGPPAARQLLLSLSIPLVEPADRAERVASNVTVVLGSAAPLIGTASPAAGTARSRPRVAFTAGTTGAPQLPTTQGVTATPVPSAAPQPSDAPRPQVVPKSEPPRG